MGVLLLVFAQPAGAGQSLSRQSLDRLRDKARQNEKTATIGADIAAAFELGDRAVPAKQLTSDRGDTKYHLLFGLPWEDGRIFMFVVGVDVVHMYLTDASLDLKRAMRVTASGIAPAPPEEARIGFQEALRTWEGLATTTKDAALSVNWETERATSFVRASLSDAGASPGPASIDQQTPTNETPALSLASLEKLRNRALHSTETARIGADLIEMLGIGSRALQAKQLIYPKLDAKFYLNFCLPSESDVIILLVKRTDAYYVYLTDSGRTLRRVVRMDDTGARLVDAATAQAGFHEALSVFEEAAANIAGLDDASEGVASAFRELLLSDHRPTLLTIPAHGTAQPSPSFPG